MITTPDTEIWPVVNKALAILPSPSLVVEVGAYSGAESRQLYEGVRREDRPCKVFAFEPDPRHFANVKKNLADLHPMVEVVNAAVGARSEVAPFYLSTGSRHENDGDWNGSSSLRKPKAGVFDKYFPWIKFPTRVDVQVVALDEYLLSRGFNCCDFLWADAQGAEKDVLDGARGVLSDARFVYLEHSPEEYYEGLWILDEMVREMEARGFSVATLFPCDVLFYNRKIFQSSPL